MSILPTIYVLVSIMYPSNDINEIRRYNQALDVAMKSYCWLGVEYDMVSNCDDASLIFYPKNDFFMNYDLLGTTSGSILLNREIYKTPEIRMSDLLDSTSFINVLKHELYHFLGGYHSLDTNSLVYPIYNKRNNTLTRYDSLVLKEIYSNYLIRQCYK